MLNAGAGDQFLCMRALYCRMVDLFLFSSTFFCFSSSKYLLGSWLAHCMGNSAMWRCDMFKQRRSFSFSYVPSTEMCFSLLSWIFFLVGMMISRTGWTSVGAFCGCVFPAGRKRFLSFFFSFFFFIIFFFERKIGVVTMYAWLGHGIYGRNGCWRCRSVMAPC